MCVAGCGDVKWFELRVKCPRVVPISGSTIIITVILLVIQYRVRINSFPEYKHLLQENYVGKKKFQSIT